MSDQSMTDEEREAARQAQIADAMAADGQAVDDGVYVDYFGFEETERVYLDSKQYVDVGALNEGGRRNYLNAVNREARISKGSGDTVIKLANGDERRILITAALTGWNLMRPNLKKPGEYMPVPFNANTVREFLDKVSPTVLDRVDKVVRKQNPWLLQDATIEDMEQQIIELQEGIEKKRAEEEGKES